MRGREWVAVTTGSANVTEETLKSKEQSEVESEKVDMVSSSLLSSLSLAASLPLVKRLASVGCDGKDTLEKGEVPGRSRLRTALLAEVSTKSKPSVDRMCSILTERKVKMEKVMMEKVMIVCPFQRQGPCVRYNERKISGGALASDFFNVEHHVDAKAAARVSPLSARMFSD